MNIQEENKLFKKHYRKMHPNSFALDTWEKKTSSYRHPSANTAWQSWLASRNREGYVLVPLEPTFHMIHEGQMVLFHGGDSAYIYRAMIQEVSK
jgi:hypothetical protein